MSIKDAWKNENIFAKQLQYNLMELSIGQHGYPPHWYAFLDLINRFKPNNILDIGCGAGVYFKLCEMYFPDMKYTGVDYAEEAVSVAERAWPNGSFAVKNIWDMDENYVGKHEAILMGALLDIMPDADAALDFALSLNPHNILISRVRLTEKPSYYETYAVYEEAETCKYYHNNEYFQQSITKHGYEVASSVGNDFGTGFDAHYYLTKCRK